MEKSPWINSKTKPAPNKKKIDEFHPEPNRKTIITTKVLSFLYKKTPLPVFT